MKEILKKFIFNLYTLIIAPLIVISLTPFWTKIKLKEFLILIITFIKSITLTILNFKIPIWAILMGVFILFLLKKSIFFKKQPKYPDWFYNFKSFKLKEWLFSWEYDLSLNIINLKPICFCKCGLVRKSHIGNIIYGSSKLYCPKCGAIYNIPNSDDLEELKVLICNQIETNSYLR